MKRFRAVVQNHCRPRLLCRRSPQVPLHAVVVYPVLHLGSRAFFDGVIDHMQDVVRVARARSTTSTGSSLHMEILKEGLTHTAAERAARDAEVCRIGTDSRLRDRFEHLLRTDQLYSEATVAEMCDEIRLPVEMFLQYHHDPKVRLELAEGYLVPKLALSFGAHLRHSDLSLEEIARLTSGDDTNKSGNSPLPPLHWHSTRILEVT